MRPSGVEFPALGMKIGGDHVRLIRDPLETVAKIVHFAGLGNFRLTGNRTEHEPAAVKKSDDALIERHHGTGLLNHRGKHVVEVERRGNLLRDFQERVEHMHLALGLEQVCIV